MSTRRARGASCDIVPGTGGAAELSIARCGMRTTNSLPRPTPALRASMRAAVQPHQALREREADAETALGAVFAAGDLGEHGEYS